MKLTDDIPGIDGDLIDYCIKGDIGAVAVLINEGANVNVKNGTPVNVAIREGWFDIAKLLIEHGAIIENGDILSYGSNGEHVESAARQGDIDMVRFLVEHGAEVTPYSYQPAAAWGHFEVFEYLFSKAGDVHAFDDASIKSASAGGHYKVVKHLIEHGANVNAGNGEPLIGAVRRGYFKIAKLLVSNGADVNVQDGSVLNLAVRAGQLNVVELLIENGADVTLNDNLAIHTAETKGDMQCVKLLIQKGANPFLGINRFKEWQGVVKDSLIYEVFYKHESEDPSYIADIGLLNQADFNMMRRVQEDSPDRVPDALKALREQYLGENLSVANMSGVSV